MSLVAGCRASQSESGGGDRSTAALVAVEGASVQTGFARGSVREDRRVSSFRISRLPVTQAEFGACVDANHCDKPDRSACSLAPRAAMPGAPAPAEDTSANAPATCVGERQAEQYCRSIGGRLPTIAEWFLAARGAAPRRFAWGDAPTSCDQHALIPSLLAQHQSLAPTLNCPSAAGLAVGQHPAGASPSGVEDVLLTSGELLTGDTTALFPACATAGSHCVVFGNEPASIDGVEPFYKLPEGARAASGGSVVVGHSYGFRCVIDGNEQVNQ